MVGSFPRPVVAPTKDYCRSIQALLTPYLKEFAVGGVDLSYRWICMKQLENGHMDTLDSRNIPYCKS